MRQHIMIRLYYEYSGAVCPRGPAGAAGTILSTSGMRCRAVRGIDVAIMVKCTAMPHLPSAAVDSAATDACSAPWQRCGTEMRVTTKTRDCSTSSSFGAYSSTQVVVLISTFYQYIRL